MYILKSVNIKLAFFYLKLALIITLNLKFKILILINIYRLDFIKFLCYIMKNIDKLFFKYFNIKINLFYVEVLSMALSE